jgi:hypothetical protein
MIEVDDFMPEGAARLSLAIWFLANQRDQEIWKAPAFDGGETQFWQDIIDNGGHPVAFVLQQEAVGVAQIPEHVLSRLRSYASAEATMRKNLYANKLRGYFISKSHQQRGDILHVIAKYWATDDGLEVLRLGWCDRLVDEPERCLIFLDKAEYHSVFFPNGLDNRAADSADEISAKGVRSKSSAPGVAAYRTGGQGKPSSMFLIIDEARRRSESDAVPHSKKLFTEQLSDWLAAEHPLAPPTTPKTIGNNATISEIHRALLLKRSQIGAAR